VNVLVDTSIWSLELCRKAHDLNPAERAVVAELTNLIKEGRARIIGLVRQELFSGIRTASQYEKLRTVLRSFPDEPVATADYEVAAKAGKDCRAGGICVASVQYGVCRALYVDVTELWNG
jgi:hypothetical protein